MSISAMMTHKGKATKDIVLVTVLQKTNSKICCQQAGDPGRPFTKAGEKNQCLSLKGGQAWGHSLLFQEG